MAGAGVGYITVTSARDQIEAAMIRGLLENAGIAGFERGGSIVVREEHAEEARAVLAETLASVEAEDVPEPANARYLAEAKGGSRRAGGRTTAASAYARMYLWGFGLMAVAFAVFLLFRAF